MAFEAVYGLPDIYFMTSQICMILASVFGDGKKKYHPGDFVPYFEDSDGEQPQQGQSVGQMMSIFEGLAKSYQSRNGGVGRF